MQTRATAVVGEQAANRGFIAAKNPLGIHASKRPEKGLSGASRCPTERAMTAAQLKELKGEGKQMNQILNEANINTLAQGLARALTEDAARIAEMNRQLMAAVIEASRAQHRQLEAGMSALVNSPVVREMAASLQAEMYASAWWRDAFNGDALRRLMEGKENGR